MRNLERLVVHVDEALRMAQYDDEAHLRVALVLLDSGAELLMHRQASSLLRDERWNFNSLEGLEAAQARFPEYRTPEYDQYAQELRSKVTSKTKRRDIARDFNAKARFLAQKEQLSGPQERVLRKLHEYRNEAYHRDRVRPETLASAVRIYSHIVCDLMERFIPDVMVDSFGDSLPPGLAAFDDLVKAHDTFDLQRAIARELLNRTGHATTQDLSEALSRHILTRLEEFEENIRYCIDNALHGETWTRATFLGLIQIEDDFEAARATPAVVRKMRFPVTQRSITSWRTRANNLAAATEPLQAFSEFADLEDEFEPIEHRANSYLQGLEAAIDLEIQRARGN